MRLTGVRTARGPAVPAAIAPPIRCLPVRFRNRHGTEDHRQEQVGIGGGLGQVGGLGLALVGVQERGLLLGVSVPRGLAAGVAQDGHDGEEQNFATQDGSVIAYSSQ